MTHNTPQTPEPLSIALLRKKLETHQEEATYRVSKGMFHSAKDEINKCIILSKRIGIELVKED